MHVVVVGGGFGGIKAALELSNRQVGKVTLISDETYFLHHATLYATATGKNTAESVIPLQTIFAKHPNVELVHDTMTALDTERKLVVGKAKQYHYDAVVLATGSVTTFFGIKGMDQHAYGIKTLEEIRRFQDHIHEEVVQKKLDKEYFIIGAGPTGVEFAGALKEYLNTLIEENRIKHAAPKITIVEAAPRILPRSSETAARIVTKRLKKMGIRVLVNHKVEALDENTIVVEGKQLPTTTAVWTSGVANNPFFTSHAGQFPLAKNGRVDVNPFLEALPHVYVIGDNNTVKHSGMAWPALNQAKYVAKRIARKAVKQDIGHFNSHSAPSGVPVGDGWGYVEWHGVYVSGWAGYQARRLMELYGYCQLVPYKTALPVWRAHDLGHIDE